MNEDMLAGMLTIRRGGERGRTLTDWLDSRHTFSFGEYRDPAHMGFRSLRVINEDRVGPGGGFPTHPHRDMEILTYVLAGAVAHRDSLGHYAVTRAGEIQRMTAGTGVSHSEYNHSDEAPLHFLQIWILPERKGIAPGYEQRALGRRKGLGLVVSRDGREGSLKIHQDAEVHAADLEPGEEAAFPLPPGRHAWVQVARGDVTVNGHALVAGDGLAASGEERVAVSARTPATLLLFDLA
jgi:redox-sensitive bicupin YhaK (pirin superfamily)